MTATALLNTLAYGDLATTTTGFAYDNRRRLRSVQTYRAAPSAWSDPSYPAPGPSDDPSQQLLLQDEDFEYDVVNNPTEIRDWRDPSEWPDGAKPVTKKIQYDDLYRVSRVDYEHMPGDDTWTSPYARENAEAAGMATPDPRRAQPSPHVDFSHRIRWQTFDYDWLGNNVVTDDDAHGFYDRSIGNIGNGTASQGPYQLTGANNAAQAGPGDSEGELETRYDPAGNLTAMKVRRAGACLPTGALCSQRFDYRWDEVGRLVRAQRWDIAEADYASEDLDGPVPAGLPAADLRYEYDAGDQRVTKQAVDDAGSDRFTLYIFESLELRRAPFASGDYELSADTEVPYLFANGVRLARVVFEDSGVPSIGGSTRHVFFELGDHLGSTSVVLDQETGELVERATFQAYGAPETDYRPERWEAFREDYRFTGKEEDVEVGLQYFGKRFLAPRLGRWTSADPLLVHSATMVGNAYAYVRGQVLRAVDVLGLDDEDAQPVYSMFTPTTNDGTPQLEGTDAVEAAHQRAEAEFKALQPPDDWPAYSSTLETNERNKQQLAAELAAEEAKWAAIQAEWERTSVLYKVLKGQGLDAEGVQRGVDVAAATVGLGRGGRAAPESAGRGGRASQTAAVPKAHSAGAPTRQGAGKASPVPEAYMDPRLLVDMEPARGAAGSTTNTLGQVRNRGYFWEQLLERNAEMFSKGNQYRIQELDLAPRVDPTWIRHNPTHANFSGETLVHHHVERGRMAVPLPQKVHQQWTSALHE